MEAKERIKYYEKTLRLLEGKGIKKTQSWWVTPKWFKEKSGICELLGLLLSDFENTRPDISQFPEFQFFHPTDEELAEEGETAFWWEMKNRIARVIALTMCIEMAKGNIEVE